MYPASQVVPMSQQLGNTNTHIDKVMRSAAPSEAGRYGTRELEGETVSRESRIEKKDEREHERRLGGGGIGATVI